MVPPPPPPPPPANARDGPCLPAVSAAPVAAALPQGLAPATTPAAPGVPLPTAPVAGPRGDSVAPPAPAVEATRPVTWHSPISDLQHLHEEYVQKTKWKKSDCPPVCQPWRVLTEEMRDCLSRLKPERMASPKSRRQTPQAVVPMSSAVALPIPGEGRPAAQPTSPGASAGPPKTSPSSSSWDQVTLVTVGQPVPPPSTGAGAVNGAPAAAASGAHSPAGGRVAEPDGPPPGLPSPGGAAAAAGGPAAGPQPKAPAREDKPTGQGKDKECKQS